MPSESDDHTDDSNTAPYVAVDDSDDLEYGWMLHRLDDTTNDNQTTCDLTLPSASTTDKQSLDSREDDEDASERDRKTQFAFYNHIRKLHKLGMLSLTSLQKGSISQESRSDGLPSAFTEMAAWSVDDDDDDGHPEQRRKYLRFIDYYRRYLGKFGINPSCDVDKELTTGKGKSAQDAGASDLVSLQKNICPSDGNISDKQQQNTLLTPNTDFVIIATSDESDTELSIQSTATVDIVNDANSITHLSTSSRTSTFGVTEYMESIQHIVDYESIDKSDERSDAQD